MTEVDAGLDKIQWGAALTMDIQDAVTAVMECEIHEGYRVDHREWEEIDWEQDLFAQPADGLLDYLAASEDAELVGALRYHLITEGPDVTEYVASMADETIHGAVTLLSGGDPVRWAVSYAVFCTLETVPEEEIVEVEPDGDDDVFEH
ncbi:MAG: hypothetical protein ACT4PP_14365 [Sporichthyaceae bacterium]